MNKKTTMGFVAVLAIGLSYSAAKAEVDRGYLSAVEIKGLRHIGQAVLLSRKKQREEDNDPELRRRVQQYHESLIKLESGMLKTMPEDSAAWSVDSAAGKLVQKRVMKSSKRFSKGRSSKGRSSDRLIHAAIQAKWALYETLGMPERRWDVPERRSGAPEMSSDMPERRLKGKRNRWRSAKRAALRKKLAEHTAQLEQLKREGPRQRLEAVSRLVKRTEIKKGRRKVDSNQPDTPLSHRVDFKRHQYRGDSKRHQSTPTIMALTRHRH